MGAALFVVAEREVPGLDMFVNGKALGRSRSLDKLAVQAGVRPLMEFFSQNLEEAAGFAEDHGIDPPTGGFLPVQWFPAADGLVAVRGLLTYLTANPSAAPDAQTLADDLREFELVLEQLAEAGVRCRLGVDY